MCWSWSLVCLLRIKNSTVTRDSLNIKAAFVLLCSTRKMQKVLSMNMDVITWTPRHPFRLVSTALAPNKGSVLQDSCLAQRCKSAMCEKLQLRILFWSWQVSEQLALSVFQRTNCPRLPSPEIFGRCEHWVTAMDDMSTPCVLVSLVAGWTTITMEVIISHWKWECSLNYLQSKSSNCHKEMPFPRYNFKQHWNLVWNN